MAESLPPPATGALGYNTFVPGRVYVDPVFDTVVWRVTGDSGRDDLYARNMWWNADETRYLHRTQGVPGQADAWDVIDLSTGAVTHTGIPFGSVAADGGFDPVDPDLVYTLHGPDLLGIKLKPDGTWIQETHYTAPAPLLEMGGSINWLDATGRSMLLRYGGEPSVRLYDRASLETGPYTGPIDATHTIGRGSYLGLSPDGNSIVGFDSRAVGVSRVGQGVRWAIDHEHRSIAPAPTVFWSLCGDHGAFCSASDGRTYMITYACYNTPGLWRVDVTNHAEGLDELQQMALPNNTRLLQLPTWQDFGHVTTVARGPLRDWAFVSTEDQSDQVNGSVEPWHPYRQEILAVNVLTGEIRRMAHHRSRSVGEDYYAEPRISCSWEGRWVGWASNFNQPGRVDVYALPMADPEPPALPVTIVLDGVTYVGTVREDRSHAHE